MTTAPITEPQISRLPIIRSCMVKLTDPELRVYGQRLAIAEKEKAQLEAELANTSKDFKGRIALKSADITKYTLLVNDEEEMRAVDCRRELHPGNRVIVRRLDTLEVVEDYAADLVALAQFRDEAAAARKRKEAEEPEGDGPPAELVVERDDEQPVEQASARPAKKPRKGGKAKR